MGARIAIESVITLQELVMALHSGSVPMAKVAKAYATLLRYAGAHVTDEEIYEEVMKVEEGVYGVLSAAEYLIQVMAPAPTKATKKAKVNG